MWDTSEYIAAAYTFGLPHPPGNPFFVLVGSLFRDTPDRAERRDADQHPRRALQCRLGRDVVSHHRARAGWMAAGALAANRWRIARGADRRDGVHRLVSVGGEREGVHGVAAGAGARVMADRALVRRSRRAKGRPPADPDRLSERARLREPHGGLHGVARGCGGYRHSATANAPSLEAAPRGNGRAPARA